MDDRLGGSSEPGIAESRPAPGADMTGAFDEGDPSGASNIHAVELNVLQNRLAETGDDATMQAQLEHRETGGKEEVEVGIAGSRAEQEDVGADFSKSENHAVLDGVGDGCLVLPEMMDAEPPVDTLERASAGREQDSLSDQAATPENEKFILMGDDGLLEALLNQHGECQLPDEVQKAEEHQQTLEGNIEDDFDGDDGLMDELLEKSQLDGHNTSHDVHQAQNVDFALGKDEEMQLSIDDKEEVKKESVCASEEYENPIVEDVALGAESTTSHDLKQNFEQDNLIKKEGTGADDATDKPELVEQLDMGEEKMVTSSSGADATKQEDNETLVTQVETETDKHDLYKDPAADENQLLVPMEQPIADEEEMAVVQPVPNAEDAVDEDLSVSIGEKGADAEASIRGGRKKRGRPKSQVPRNQPAKPQYKKKLEEDVCFICFDGGNLVVCDRRGCPKVYHPTCVNRDEAFFRAKGRWNCGWHICSLCEKAAHYMCYTCTYSLCKICIREADFVCVRGNKGFCGTCRSTVMLIETNTQAGVNFDDKNSWEYLFKDYWLDLKGRLSITFDEVSKAKKPSKRSLIRNEESSDDNYEANEIAASSSDSSSGRRDESISRKKVKRGRKAAVNDDNAVGIADSVGSSLPAESEWASKELLEFVSHMKDGDMSVLSQFDVQALLLEYIKRNNLRDPRRKSQILCDSRLENLFGKPRVGHFEMLKLLESHFLIKESSQVGTDDDAMASGDTDTVKIDTEGSSDAKSGLDKKKKSRKKDERETVANYCDYAAIDVHNISMIYLRRNLMEELIDDLENFCQKVVGSFVRIRISGSNQRQDMYRLVLVTGISNATEKYKTGKKTTDIMLEILNLNKPEVIPIDSISNQEFTEEECKRLRQSIKIGFIPRMTVGELQEKAMALQAIKVNDWLETEKLRLSHLRDRASETGRRKQLRECVEKLELLNTPEERSRRLNEIPEVHSDPNMDPNYESAEEDDSDKREKNSRARDSNFIRRRVPGSFERPAVANDSWNVSRSGSTTMLEPSRDVSADIAINASDPINGPSWSRGKDTLEQHGSDSLRNHAGMPVSHPRHMGDSQTSGAGHQSGITSHSPAGGAITNMNESDKIWHYQDPSGKVQGPFSMVQLRKWNSTGYFPRDLRIWKTSEKQDDSVLLTDALIGKFQKDSPSTQFNHNSISQVKDTTTANPLGNTNSKWAENVRTNPYQSAAVHQNSGLQNNGQQSQFQSSLTALSIPEPLPSNLANHVGIKSTEWSMPSPTPTSEPIGLDDRQDSGQVFDPENASASVVAAPQNVNPNWGTSMTGNVNNMWGPTVHAKDNANWAPENPNVNVGWASVTPGNPTANTVSGPPGNPNAVAGWGAPSLGGLPATAGWVASMQVTAPLNPSWGPPVQGFASANPSWVMTGQENAGAAGSWAAPQAPQQGHVNPVASWGTVGQGIQNPNPGWNTGNGNNNLGWNGPSANPSNRTSHQRENRDRHSGNHNSYEAGRDGGRQRIHHGGRGSSWSQRGEKQGVCKYHESGRCNRGSSCNFLHT